MGSFSSFSFPEATLSLWSLGNRLPSLPYSVPRGLYTEDSNKKVKKGTEVNWHGA